MAYRKNIWYTCYSCENKVKRKKYSYTEIDWQGYKKRCPHCNKTTIRKVDQW